MAAAEDLDPPTVVLLAGVGHDPPLALPHRPQLARRRPDQRRETPVVGGQPVADGVGEVLLEPQDAAGVGPLPGVDGLGRVADDEDVGVHAQDPDQFRLGGVRVLVLVAQQVPGAVAPEAGVVGGRPQDLDRPHDALAEVDEVVGGQLVAVGGDEGRDPGEPGVGVGDGGVGGHEALLEVGDAGGEFLVVELGDVGSRPGSGNQRNLAFLVDEVGRFGAGEVGVALHDVVGEAVVGGHDEARTEEAVLQPFLEPFLHDVAAPAGVGEAGDRRRVDAALHQQRHPFRQHPGLAGAGGGHHGDPAGPGLDDAALVGIEQNGPGGRELGGLGYGLAVQPVGHQPGHLRPAGGGETGRRQRPPQVPAVAPEVEAPVEDDDGTLVGLGPHQPAEHLPEPAGHPRHHHRLEVGNGVPELDLVVELAGQLDRVEVRVERQLAQDDQAEGGPRHVDPLPERAQAEEHDPLAPVGGGGQAPHQGVAGPVVLGEDGDVGPGLLPQQGGQRPHRLAGGEQHQGPAADGPGRRPQQVAAAVEIGGHPFPDGSGQVGDGGQEDLVREVERARLDQRAEIRRRRDAGAGDSHLRQEGAQVGRFADGERGGDEHPPPAGGEDTGGEPLGDRQRRAEQLVGPRPGARRVGVLVVAALPPVDGAGGTGVAFEGVEEVGGGGEVPGQGAEPGGQGPQRLAPQQRRTDRFGQAGDAGEGDGELPPMDGQVVDHQVDEREGERRTGLGFGPVDENVETVGGGAFEGGKGVLEGPDRPFEGVGGCGVLEPDTGQDTGQGPGDPGGIGAGPPVDLAGQESDLDGAGEGGLRRFGEEVGLVDHVVGIEERSRLPRRVPGQEQGVVHDDQVGVAGGGHAALVRLEGPPPGIAGAVGLAGRDAPRGAAGELALQFVEPGVGRLEGPGRHDKHRHRLQTVESRRVAGGHEVEEVGQQPQAEVVALPDQDRGGALQAEFSGHAQGGRKIVGPRLLLERFRVRGHVGGGRLEEGGDEVAERLARTGAGLADEEGTVGQGAEGGGRQPHLGGPRDEPGAQRKRAPVGEQRGGDRRVEGRRRPGGGRRLPRRGPVVAVTAFEEVEVGAHRGGDADPERAPETESLHHTGRGQFLDQAGQGGIEAGNGDGLRLEGGEGRRQRVVGHGRAAQGDDRVEGAVDGGERGQHRDEGGDVEDAIGEGEVARAACSCAGVRQGRQLVGAAPRPDRVGVDAPFELVEQIRLGRGHVPAGLCRPRGGRGRGAPHRRAGRPDGRQPQRLQLPGGRRHGAQEQEPAGGRTGAAQPQHFGRGAEAEGQRRRLGLGRAGGAGGRPGRPDLRRLALLTTPFRCRPASQLLRLRRQAAVPFFDLAQPPDGDVDEALVDQGLDLLQFVHAWAFPQPSPRKTSAAACRPLAYHALRFPSQRNPADFTVSLTGYVLPVT